MDDDRTLTRRMLAGNEEAFEELFDRFFPALFRFALARLGGDSDAAEEVVQSTLIQAVAKLGTYRGEAALLTWLSTICRREIGAFCARRGRSPVEPIEDAPAIRAALESLAEGADDPEAALSRKEVGRLVRVTLDHLSPRHRSALEWKYLEGLTVIEIAARLELSPKAAES
ncbi:MAG TPA: sigma-70 family RNA polymerase sigma factor, partial [Thermoanaerobaculia bacterium]|nr:sigma-70 family RNA polymerase sigma factor [Thermoanaerobaculia bacterium]